MAIEDMSSPAWLEYQKRRQCDQNRRHTENEVPAPDGAIDERNDRSPGSSTPLEVSQGNDKGRDMEECRGVVPAIAHDKSLLQQVPHDHLAPPSPSTSSQRRGVKRKQEEASSPDRARTSQVSSGPGSVERRRGVKRMSTEDDGENVQLSYNGSVRSEEVGSAGSLRELFDDGSVHGEEGAIGHAAVDMAHADEESDVQMGLLAKHLSCLRTPSENAASAAGEPTEATSGDHVAAEGQPSQPPDLTRSSGAPTTPDDGSAGSQEEHFGETTPPKDAEDERATAQRGRGFTKSRKAASEDGVQQLDDAAPGGALTQPEADQCETDVDMAPEQTRDGLQPAADSQSMRPPETASWNEPQDGAEAEHLASVPVTSIFEEWKRLCAGGYAIGTGLLTTTLSRDGKETKSPQPGKWRQLTRREASFCNQEDNMLFMPTGLVNDVIVLDVDLGNGMTAYRALLESAGIPFGRLDHTLTQSGGRHAFFSYEKSVRAGLEVASWKPNQMSNRVKMKLDGQSVSIDLRGDGGLIILPPTWVTFHKTTGETKRYVALQQLPPRGGLPPMPKVLLDFLNSQTTSQKEKTGGAERPGRRIGGPARITLGAQDETGAPVEGELRASVMARLDALLARNRGRGSLVYYKRERMESGEWRFQYAPRGAWVCGHDEAHRGSNGVSFFYDPQTDRFTERCHGGECDRRARTVLQEDPAVAGIISENCGIGPVCGTDQSIYKRVPLELVAKYLRLSADGGSRLFRALYAGDPRIKWVAGSSSGSGAGFYYWNGKVFEKDIPEAQGGMVHNLIADQLTQATDLAYKEAGKLKKGAEQSGDEAGAKNLSFLLPKKRPRWNGPGGPGGVIKYARHLFHDPTFMKQLDYASKWFLPAENGVIDLRDGVLHPHHPRYMFSNTIAVDFPEAGLGHPTPFVESILADAWMLDVHPERAEIVAYLQRVLGYLLTGDVDERLLVYIYGPTASGKGLLMEAMRDLLGSFFLQGNKSIIFKAAGQSDISRGGANTDLAATKKKRLVLFDETGEVDRLDDAGVKYMTGGADINARELYERGVDATFKPTAKFVVTSNRPPLLDFTDAAMEDRLVYFPLERSFVKQEKYVEGNPWVRLRDLTMKDRMKTPEAQTELLVWLVNGQVRNARAGGIGAQPEYLKEAKRELYASNDTLGVFISAECEVGSSFMVQAQSLLATYNAYLAQEQKGKCRPSVLAKLMKEKNFEKEERARHPEMVNQFVAYKGLRVNKESSYWELIQAVVLHTDEERRSLRQGS